MKQILVIDNYDSFTYNLVHLIEEIVGYSISVWRNDEIDYDNIDDYEYIVLSPGPGIPEEAGDLKKVIKQYAPRKKILGVCLGHQAIGEVYGASLQNLAEVYHGVQTPIKIIEQSALLRGLDETFPGGRYHSWVIKRNTMNEDFTVTSTDEKGEIMSFRHNQWNLFGVQFHPESILTPEGKIILQNFLSC